jgi:hypothetical protein
LARSVTTNDLYAFNPDINPSIDDFREIIDRHFRHPPEGLGYDNTAAAICGAQWRIPTHHCSS